MNNREEVENLQRDLRGISEKARDQFGALSLDQLNWKPSVDRWSVAQCFDHLINTNASYFTIFDSVAAGTLEPTFVQKLPGVPKMWGKLLIKSLDPKTTRKLKAPKRFEPASSDLSASIIDNFVKNQNRVVDSMERTKNLEVGRIIISSPAAAMITYSLLDAFRIIAVHEQRHFQQAQRVTQEPSFPS